MKFSIATVVTFAAAALAAPSQGWTDAAKCNINDKTAKGLVDGFGTLLTAFNVDTANNILSATKFTDTSSSINFLAGQPLNGVTFPNRQAFIAGQGSQPPIGFEVLGIDAVSCKDKNSAVIAFRWLAKVGGNRTGGAKGINVLYVSKDKAPGQKGVDGWVIDTVYSEFNSAVWAIEFGGTCAVPTRPAALFA